MSRHAGSGPPHGHARTPPARRLREVASIALALVALASTVARAQARAVVVTPDGATATRLPSNGTNYVQVFVVANTGVLASTYSLAATVAPAGIVTIVSVNGVAGSTGTTGLLAGRTGTANVTVAYSVASGAATGATAQIVLTASNTAVGTVSNTGDLTVTVARAGLSIAKQLYRDDRTTLITAGDEVSADEYVQYRVTVTSTGSAAAAAVSVADAVPAELTYDAASGDVPGWGFTTAGSTVTATLAGTLASGASRFFWIRVRVK
jgi:uncharacterized repeat protein (TIGR01451 family)